MPLKRISAILFLSVYLLSYAEFYQLLKLPILFEHFREHRQTDQTISFLSFIRIHYFDKTIIDDDYQRDQQLPLRHSDGCQMIVNHPGECQQIAIEIIKPNESPRQFSCYKEMNKPQFITFDIFQPPRRTC